MADYRFNQEWAEPLTLREQLVVEIGLQISDNLSLPWQDGVSFLKTASGAGTVVQTQFSEDLSMAPQGDLARVGFGLVITDSIALIDTFFYAHVQRTAGGNTGSRIAIGDGGTIRLVEAVVTVLQLRLSFSDSLNYWLDQQSPPIVAEWDVIIICPHLNNWADNQVDFIVTPDQVNLSGLLVMSDAFSFSLSLQSTLSDTLTLSDVLAIGYGDVVTDSLSLSDGLRIGYGDSVADTLTLSDVLAIGYGDLISDVLTLTDAFAFTTGSSVLTEVLSDTLSMSDAIVVGYGNSITDSFTLIDSLGVGYGNVVSDQLVLSDQAPTITGEYDLALACPHLNNWLDAESNQFGIAEALSDSLTMSDALKIGYGDLIAESLALTEGFIIEEFGGSFIYELIFGGVIVVATGTVGAESLSLSDALLIVFGSNESFVDALTLSDALGVGYGEGLVEQLSFSDSSSLGFGFVISDQLNMLDALLVGYGDLLTDSLVLTDAFSSFLNQPGLTEILSDTLTLSDSLLLGYGNQIAEQLTQSAQVVVGYGNLINDTQALSDGFLSVFGLVKIFSDSLTLSDALLGGYGNQIIEALVLNDSIGLGVGFLPSDQLVLSDALVLGYGDLVVDSLVLIDSFSQGIGLAEILSDILSLSDSNLLGVGLQTADSITLSDVLLVGYGSSVAELLSLSDVLAIGYGDLVVDQVVLTEAFASGFGGSFITEVLSDSLTLSDALAIGYGNRVADQLVLADRLPTITGEYDLIIGCPHLNNWLDAVSRLEVFLESFSDTLVFSDNFKNSAPPLGSLFDAMAMADLLTIGYGDAVTDQLLFSEPQFGFVLPGDAMGQAFEEVLSLVDQVAIFVTIPVFADDMIMSDAFAFTLANATILQEALADTLAISDKLRIGYGLRLALDQLSLTDADVVFLSTANLPEILSDTLVILDQLTGIGYGLQIAEVISSVVQLVQDTFNRPNESPINTHWIAAGSFPMPRLTNLSATPVSTALQSDVALFGSISWPSNQYSQAKLVQLKQGAGYIALVLRCDATGQNFYYIDLDASPGFGGVGVLTPLNLQKVVNGVLQGPPYVSFGNVTPQIGDVFRASIIGAKILVYQNEVLIGTFVDPTPISSGSAGILLQTASGMVAVTDVALSNWSGGLAVELVDQLQIGYGLLLDDLQVTLAQVTQDNFTRVNESPLNPATWTTQILETPLQIVSNRCEATFASGSGSGELYTGITWGNDQWASATLASSVGGASLNIRLRAGEDLGTQHVFGYDFGFLDNGNGTCQATISLLLANGTVTLLSFIAALPFSIGDVFLAVVLGKALAFYKNGVQIGLATDTTFQSGAVWLHLFAPTVVSDIQLANFAGGLPASMMVDQLTIGTGNIFTDSMTMAEASLVGYGETISEALTISDSLVVGYGDLITDQLVPMTDVPVLSALLQTEILSDQLSLSDKLLVGYGLGVVDQLGLADSLSLLGYGDLIADQLALLDGISLQLLGGLISIFPSDQLVMTDSLTRIGIGDLIAEQLPLVEAVVLGLGLILNDQMLAQVDQIMAGSGITVSDQAPSLSDQMALVEALLIKISDATPVQLDALATLFNYGLQLNDVVAFHEQMTLLWGIIVAGESLSMADLVTSPSLQNLISLALADDESAAWLESVLTAFVFAPTEIILHSLTVLPEVVAGLQVAAEVQVAFLEVATEVEEEVS